jgi:hypothetical protein
MLDIAFRTPLKKNSYLSLSTDYTYYIFGQWQISVWSFTWTIKKGFLLPPNPETLWGTIIVSGPRTTTTTTKQKIYNLRSTARRAYFFFSKLRRVDLARNASGRILWSHEDLSWGHCSEGLLCNYTNHAEGLVNSKVRAQKKGYWFRIPQSM